MKVVFLDFDGVLNAEVDDPGETETELWTASWIDAAMVARLDALVAATGARVVVSSSWRQRRTIDELREILRMRGFTGVIADVTPRLGRPPEGERLVRAAEIGAWLAAHAETTQFVILDDDEDLGAFAAHHVRTESRVGFTEGDAARARAILEGA